MGEVINQRCMCNARDYMETEIYPGGAGASDLCVAEFRTYKKGTRGQLVNLNKRQTKRLIKHLQKAVEAKK